jgi:hypothetical protein
VLNAKPKSRIVCPPGTVKILTSQGYNGARKLRSTSPRSKQKQNSSGLCLIDSVPKVDQIAPRSDCSS